jgi:hypothetical protein
MVPALKPWLLIHLWYIVHAVQLQAIQVMKYYSGLIYFFVSNVKSSQNWVSMERLKNRKKIACAANLRGE